MKKVFMLSIFLIIVWQSSSYASATDGIASFSWSESLGNLYADIIDIVKSEIKK